MLWKILAVVSLFIFSTVARAQDPNILPNPSFPGAGTSANPYALPAASYGTAYTPVNLISSVVSGTTIYVYQYQGTPWTVSGTLETVSGTSNMAGDYRIALSTNNSGSGPFTWFDLQVNSLPLIITASNATKVYGAAMPGLTYAYTGFIDGDNESTTLYAGSVVATTTATAASPVGQYATQVTLPYGFADFGDYYIASTVNGTLTVTPAPLQISVPNVTTAYGTIPALTPIYSGFVNGDGPSNLTQQAVLSTNATSTSPPGTYSIVVATFAVDANYNITYPGATQVGTLTITPAPLTISAQETITYGDPIPPLTASYSGFVNGENASNLTTQPTVTTTATNHSVAGTYPITISGATDPDYSITYGPSTLTIQKAELTVTADNQTITYGSTTVPLLTLRYSGFVNGETVSVISSRPSVMATVPARAPVGTYPITPNGGSSQNYTFNYVNGTLTVAPANLTITASDASSTYGSPLSTVLNVSYSGFVNGDQALSLTTKPVVTNAAYAGAPAGTYTLTPSGAADPNYNIQYANGTYTINPANLQIMPSTENMTYGSAVPTLNLSYTGFVNGDGPGNLSALAIASTTATSASGVGTYPITVAGANDANYSITYGTSSLSVEPAVLTVTATDEFMTYGGTVPVLPVAYSGFVNGDDPSSLSAPAIASTTATSASGVGTYPITVSGASDPNYTIGYVTGTLTVNPAVLTVTATDVTKTYGSVTPVLPLTFSGFANGDDFSSLGFATAVTPASHYSPVGTYPINPSSGSDANYTIIYVSGTLTITPATLTVTAADANMAYGGTVPVLPVTYSGFVGGDNASSLTSLPITTTTATSASSIGQYPITVGGGQSTNYTFTYVQGTLTIGPATLMVTATNESMTYGGPLPVLPVTYSGFVNGEDALSLTTPAVATTTATSASPAGTYSIVPSGGSSSNYTLTYVNGILSIDPATLEVTANAETKVYDTPDPFLSYTVNGLVNGDGTTIFSGGLSRDTGENVGTYPITEGTLSAGGNYVINFTGNNLVINKALQEISWTQSLIFGCDTTTQIQLTATSSSGLPVTYTSSDPNVVTVNGDVLTRLQTGTAIITASQSGDANHIAASQIEDTAVYRSASMVRQHWADVLFFDNTGDNYVQWQWYKNGVAITGATGDYYSETPSLNGQYFVIATDNAGQSIQSCPLSIMAGGAIAGGVSVFPNPVATGGSVTIVCNYSASALQGAHLQLIDMSGKVWQQLTNVQPSRNVTVPSVGGIYIINLLLSNGQKASVNVLVGK